MRGIPEDLRRQVIAEVYRRADQLDWEGLAQAQRSGYYDRWLDDPDIGGILIRFMPRERARVWIKDVPMKHYARARSGIGPYAGLVTRQLPGPSQIARQTLGARWSLIDDTIRDKPNRCLITDGRDRRLMIWGAQSNLRALVWAGINAVVDNEPTPVVIVATPQGHRLSEGEQARHLRIGRQAGIEIRHTTLRDQAKAEPSSIRRLDLGSQSSTAATAEHRALRRTPPDLLA